MDQLQQAVARYYPNCVSTWAAAREPRGVANEAHGRYSMARVKDISEELRLRSKTRSASCRGRRRARAGALRDRDGGGAQATRQAGERGTVYEPEVSGAIERRSTTGARRPGRCASCRLRDDRGRRAGAVLRYALLVSHRTGVAPARARTAMSKPRPGRRGRAAPGTVHVSIAILLLHYCSPPTVRRGRRWVTFRELPDGLFYAQAFAAHAEAALAAVVAAGAGDGGVDGPIRLFCERGARSAASLST